MIGGRMFKKQFRAVQVALLLAAMASVGAPAIAQNQGQSGYQAAIAVAQAGYRDFLHRALTDYAKRQHKLAADDTADSAALGAPFRLNVIDPQALGKCTEKTCASPAAIGIPIDTYFFPIAFNGRMKLIMTVIRLPGKGHFEIGSLGYRRLAKELQTALRQWPKERGYDIELYVCHQALSYAFSVLQYPSANLTLFNAVGEDEDAYRALTPLAQSIAALRDQVAKTLSKGGFR